MSTRVGEPPSRCAVCFEDVVSTPDGAPESYQQCKDVPDIKIRNGEFVNCQCQTLLCENCCNRLIRCPTCQAFKRTYMLNQLVVLHMIEVPEDADSQPREIPCHPICKIRAILILTGILNCIVFFYLYKIGSTQYFDSEWNIFYAVWSFVTSLYLGWIRFCCLSVSNIWRHYPIVGLFDLVLLFVSMLAEIVVMTQTDFTQEASTAIFVNNMFACLALIVNEFYTHCNQAIRWIRSG